MVGLEEEEAFAMCALLPLVSLCLLSEVRCEPFFREGTTNPLFSVDKRWRLDAKLAGSGTCVPLA